MMAVLMHSCCGDKSCFQVAAKLVDWHFTRTAKWSHSCTTFYFASSTYTHDILKKAQDSVISSQIGIKYGRIVPPVNMHWSTESDFQFDITLSRWRPWRHIKQKSVATWERTQSVWPVP